MPEGDSVAVEELRARVRTSASEWNSDAYREALEEWDEGTRTVKPLRTCIYNYCKLVLKLRIRVKRRQRMTVLEELVRTASDGYFLGRYLLRTTTHSPTYWTDGDDRNAEATADSICDGTPEWDFKSFQTALLDSNQELSEAIDSWASLSPLLDLLGDEQGRSAYRGLFAFGLASAMSEQVVFGPI